jgi:peptidoglycan/LPS O-acetylase OafA/YrhL
MGVCLGLLFLQRGQSQVQPSSKDDWRFDGALVALVGAIALICVLNPTWPYGYTVSSLEAPLFALVILVLAYQRGYIARVLSTPVMIFLGEISYAIYVLHWPIWFLLARVLPAPVPIPVFLVLVGGITSLSYVYIERPARKAIRAWWKQREERMRESVPTAEAPEIVQARTL